jgi:hypothetical protein
MTALNWGVSQGTSLYNVQINMPNFSQHYGIEMLSNAGCCGGGSGTMLGDIVSMILELVPMQQSLNYLAGHQWWTFWNSPGWTTVPI